MRKQLWLGLVVCILLAVGLGAWLWLRPQAAGQPADSAVSHAPYRQLTLRLGSQTIHLDIADTPALQELGLGGRDSMAGDRGMLFAFAYADQRCFWMKDMLFSIDIIWVDGHKRIGHIDESLSPDSYPQTFCPDVASQYVIELNAGMASKAGLKTGDVLPITL